MKKIIMILICLFISGCSLNYNVEQESKVLKNGEKVQICIDLKYGITIIYDDCDWCWSDNQLCIEDTIINQKVEANRLLHLYKKYDNKEVK